MADMVHSVVPNIDKCHHCDSRETLKRCSRCKSVAYCCREHQKQDWSKHKNHCLRIDLDLDIPRNNLTVSNTSKFCKSKPKRQSQTNTTNNNSIKSLRSNDQQKEIEHILDFSNVGTNCNRSTRSNTADSEIADKEVNKDIFTDLIESKTNDYHGPNDDLSTNPAYNDVDDTTTSNVSNAQEIGIYFPISSDENVSMDQHTSRPRSSARTVQENVLLGSRSTHESSLNDNSQEDRSQQSDNGPDDLTTPFDERPLQQLEFPKPDSFHHKDLAEFVSIGLINHGYCVVDGVFSESEIEGATNELRELKRLDALKTGKLRGGRTSGNESEKVIETAIRSDLIKWIDDSDSTLPFATNILITMDSIISFINNKHMSQHGLIEGRTKVCLLIYM